FWNRRLLDGNSSFRGELLEFALGSWQFVRLQPPCTQKGYSYGGPGRPATGVDNARKQDNDHRQGILQWMMRPHADVHESVPRTIAFWVSSPAKLTSFFPHADTLRETLLLL